MHAVVLSFPGHLFQTALTVQSLHRHYPEIDFVSFVIDDMSRSGWHEYVDDFSQVLSSHIKTDFRVYISSDLELIKQCVSGWWRQQLIKLTLDLIVPGDQWLVVDGDVFFESRCEIKNLVPVTYQHDYRSKLSRMIQNYVTHLLGTDQSCILGDLGPAGTSGIPFRYLDRLLLESLRKHVESRFDKNFVQLHLDWFDDQTIVADWPTADRLSMSEWELIECFRRYVAQTIWPTVEVGSGYRDDIDLGSIDQKENLFRHSYQRDSMMPQAWFIDRGVELPQTVWQRSVHWLQVQQ